MPIDPIERADQLAKRSPRELALLVVEAEKELARFQALNSELCHAHNVLLLDGSRWQTRAEAAEQESAQLRSALAELVRLKLLRDKVGRWSRAEKEDYETNKPLAWEAAFKLVPEAARKALEPTGEPNE